MGHVYVVKIKHQKCLLQVNHVRLKVLSSKIIISVMKEFFFVIPEEYNEQGNAMSDVTYLSIGAS